MTTYHDKVRIEFIDLENKSLRDIAGIVYDLRQKVNQYEEEIDSLKRTLVAGLQYVPNHTLIDETTLPINLNTIVEVHLTDKGLEVLNAYYKIVPDALKDNLVDNTFTNTLWRIMNVFGSFIDGTNREVYFSDNQITLKFD
jgi:hypothetical protein